jgi:hypothetical protein
LPSLSNYLYYWYPFVTYNITFVFENICPTTSLAYSSPTKSISVYSPQNNNNIILLSPCHGSISSYSIIANVTSLPYQNLFPFYDSICGHFSGPNLTNVLGCSYLPLPLPFQTGLIYNYTLDDTNYLPFNIPMMAPDFSIAIVLFSGPTDTISFPFSLSTMSYSYQNLSGPEIQFATFLWFNSIDDSHLHDSFVPQFLPRLEFVLHCN